MNDPIGYARHFRLMIVPVTYGGDYQFEEARPATLVDLALAGVKLAPTKVERPDLPPGVYTKG